MNTMTRPAVLIVDDNSRLLRGLTRLLGDEFRVATAVSGAEAIAILANQSFDVVLADHQMPGTTGVRMLAQAMESYPHLVPILMSGEVTPLVRKLANEIGVRRVLEKPFRSVQVVEAIYAALAQRKADEVAQIEEARQEALLLSDRTGRIET